MEHTHTSLGEKITCGRSAKQLCAAHVDCCHVDIGREEASYA
jgi:hypothetical protein